MLAAGEDAAEQDRGVDGGDFRVPDAFAGVDVGEVKEESAMGGQLSSTETTRVLTTRSARRPGARRSRAFLAMQMAVRPKPVEAMLATMPVSLTRTLQRSLIRPVCGLACSQKKRKLAFELVEELIVLGGKCGGWKRRWFISPPRRLLRGCVCPRGRELSRARAAERVRRWLSGAAGSAVKCDSRSHLHFPSCPFRYLHALVDSGCWKLMQPIPLLNTTHLLNNRCKDSAARVAVGQQVLRVARPIVYRWY